MCSPREVMEFPAGNVKFPSELLGRPGRRGTSRTVHFSVPDGRTHASSSRETSFFLIINSKRKISHDII